MRLSPILLLLSISAATKLDFVIDTQFASPAYYDSEALLAAETLLESITDVVTEFDDQRWIGGMETDCTPSGDSRWVELTNLKHGQVLIFLYTTGPPQVPVYSQIRP